MRTADVLIAGGGLIGLTAAYFLQERGLRVRLFEAGGVGREASWAGGGILWPLYPWLYPHAVQSLAAEGRALYPEFVDTLAARTGIDPEYRRTGLIMADVERVSAMLEWCREQEEPCERLDGRAAAALEPGMAGIEAGVFAPAIAQVRNPLLCEALAMALRAEGVELHERERVVSVAHDRGRFLGFRTARGLHRAGVGIVATGAWAGDLLQPLGGPAIEPVKGQMLLFKGKPGILRHIVLATERYLIPRADGHILVGSTLESGGFDKSVDDRARAELAAFCADWAPGLRDLVFERHWAGLRPAGRDEVPYIGPVPGVDGVFASTGHYRNGVVTAPASAQLLARMVAGEAVDAEAYRLDR